MFIVKAATVSSCLVASGALACSILEGPGSDTAELPRLVMNSDVTPPSSPTLSDVAVQLAPRPRPTFPGAPIAGCTPMDVLAFTLSGTDDVTSRQHLRAQLFIADTEAALATSTKVARTWRFDDVAAAPVRIVLSSVVDRSVQPKFCFAVQLVDEAANVGPRSSATCIDTSDVADPRVELPEDEPLRGCSITAGGPLGLVALLALVSARQRRAPKSA